MSISAVQSSPHLAATKPATPPAAPPPTAGKLDHDGDHDGGGSPASAGKLNIKA